MHDNQKVNTQKRFLDVQEVADMLDLPRSTVYERAKKGVFPGVVRIGYRIKINAAKLEAWLDAGGDADGQTPEVAPTPEPAKPKRLPRSLPKRVRNALQDEGISTLDELMAASPRRLKMVGGIGEVALREIAAVTGRDLTAEDERRPAPWENSNIFAMLDYPDDSPNAKAIVSALASGGITTVAELREASDERLLGLYGIGPHRLAILRERLAATGPRLG